MLCELVDEKRVLVLHRYISLPLRYSSGHDCSVISKGETYRTKLFIQLLLCIHKITVGDPQICSKMPGNKYKGRC